MSYDFSHCSPEDTKTAISLVHRIEDIIRDIDLCSSDISKSILKRDLIVYYNLLELYKDPNLYNNLISLRG